MSNSSPLRPSLGTSLCRLLNTCLLFTFALSLPAQAPPAKPDQAPAAKPEQTPAGPATTTLSVDARLVNLPVVVRDKKGALIQTLTKDDFVLRVDGHPQNIRYFDQDRNLPLTLGLLVDTSGSQRNALDDERTASSAFLDNMLTAPPNASPTRPSSSSSPAGRAPAGRSPPPAPNSRPPSGDRHPQPNGNAIRRLSNNG